MVKEAKGMVGAPSCYTPLRVGFEELLGKTVLALEVFRQGGELFH